MLDRPKKRLQRIFVWYVIDHRVEAMADSGALSLRSEDRSDDLLRRLLAEVDGVPIGTGSQQPSASKVFGRNAKEVGNE